MSRTSGRPASVPGKQQPKHATLHNNAAKDTAAVAEPSSSVVIPEPLLKTLHPHQIEGIHFLWKRLVDDGILPTFAESFAASVARRVELRQRIFGSVLGHSMGLGKTVTTISFLLLFQACVILMAAKRASASARSDGALASCARAIRVLIICPRSTSPHWQDNFAEWMKPQLFGRVVLPLYTPAGNRGRVLRECLYDFHEKGGVLLLGYEEYVGILRGLKRGDIKLDDGAARPYVGSLLDCVRQPLPAPVHSSLLSIVENADVVVLDESHRLKRGGSRLCSELQEHLRAVQMRIALTGTPFQNHLEEYNVMTSVVTGTYLDPQRFRQHLVLPIQRGQCSDATPAQFHEMQKCVAALRRHFASTVHRKGPEILERDLPERSECVVFVVLSPKQEEAYKALLRHHEIQTAASGPAGEGGGLFNLKPLKTSQIRGNPSSILSFQQTASHIFCHPDLWAALFARKTGRGTSAASGAVVQWSSPLRGYASTGPAAAENSPPTDPTKRATRAARVSALDISSESDGEEEIGFYDAMEPRFSSDGKAPVPPAGISGEVNINDSPKLRICLSLVKSIVQGIGDKVVVFSQYLAHLALLEYLLAERLGIPCVVFTGSLNVDARKQMIDMFNKSVPPNPPAVMLCSTRAGGVGVNLVGANHCILFDTSWNPADDTQATYRLYRYGQRKRVYIYRLTTFGTSEHVVFFYALLKSWVHKKIADVADPTRQERHMKDYYYTYPCGLPIDDGTESLTEAFLAEHSAASPKALSSREEAELQRRKRDFFLNECAKFMPALCLAARDGSFHDVRSLVRHSFLLRDDTLEVIQEMERRFKEEEELRRVRSLPKVIVDPRHGEDMKRVAPPTDAKRCFTECEPPLQRELHAIANHLLLRALERRAGFARVETGSGRSAQGSAGALSSAGARPLGDPLAPLASSAPRSGTYDDDSTAQRRVVEREMCALLAPLLLEDRSATLLVEIVFAAYRQGVHDLLRHTLSSPAYHRTRTLLASRVSGLDASSGVASAPHYDRFCHGPPSSNAEPDSLEKVLLSNALTFFQRFSPDQVTVILTECGFARAFVPQCVMNGFVSLFTNSLVHGAWSTGPGSTATAALEMVSQQLTEVLGGRESSPGGTTSDNAIMASPTMHFEAQRSASPETLPGAVLLSRERLLTTVRDTVLASIEELWPPYSGLILPRPAINTTSLPDHEHLFLWGYEGSARKCAESAATLLRENFPKGLLSISDAARMMQLSVKCYGGLRIHDKASQQYHMCNSPMFQCPRCRAGTVGVTTVRHPMQCAQCHYNLDFEVRYDAKFHHLATMYTFIVLMEALGTLSIGHSFTMHDTPRGGKAPGARLLQLPTPSGAPDDVNGTTAERAVALLLESLEQKIDGLSASLAFPSAETRSMSHWLAHANEFPALLAIYLLAAGVDVFCREVPQKHVRVVAIQCGAPTTDDLKRMLVVNSDYAWKRVVGRHLRDVVTECVRQILDGGVDQALGTTGKPRSSVHSRRGSMPEIFIILALDSAIKCSGLTHALQLLQRSKPKSAHGALSVEQRSGDMSEGAAEPLSDREEAVLLLRLVCDLTVRWLYVQRLVSSPMPMSVRAVSGFSDEDSEPSTESAPVDDSSSDSWWSDPGVSLSKRREQQPPSLGSSVRSEGESSESDRFYAFDKRDGTPEHKAATHTPGGGMAVPVGVKRPRRCDSTESSDQSNADPSDLLSPMSSFKSCYSDDDGEDDSKRGAWSQNGAGDAKPVTEEGSWEATSPGGSDVRRVHRPTREQVSHIMSDLAGDGDDDEEAAARATAAVHAEAVKVHRSNLYWSAHMEVYGCDASARAAVFVADAEDRRSLLPPPSAAFWAAHSHSVSREGLTLMAVVDILLSVLLDNVSLVPLIDITKGLVTPREPARTPAGMRPRGGGSESTLDRRTATRGPKKRVTAPGWKQLLPVGDQVSKRGRRE